MITLVKPVRYCPISGNNPMCMTAASFERTCATFQEKARRPWTSGGAMNVNRITYCRICKGRKGPEITLVETFEEILNGENIMRKTVNDTCYLCGKEKQLKKHFDKFVCSVCQVIRIAAKNSPDVVIRALEEENVSVPSDSAVDHAIEKYKEHAAKLEQELAGEREVSDLNAEQAKRVGAELDKARFRIADLETRVIRLQENSIGKNENVSCGIDRQFIEDLSGRLAVSIVLNKPPQLTANDIMVLRGESDCGVSSGQQ